MSKSFNRILKFLEILIDSNDKSINTFCTYVDSYIKKHAHFKPDDSGTTPALWKKNLDYAPSENSPYYGSMKEFLKKFPGGISEWRKKREKNKKKRFKEHQNKKTAHLMTKHLFNHSNNVEGFRESPQYYINLMDKIISMQEECKNKNMSADDAKKYVKDMINYWKILLKEKKGKK